MKIIAPAFMSVAMLTLILTTACSEEKTGTESTAADTVAAKGTVAKTYDGEGSIMDQPVDFSSAEAVEASMELIRNSAGEKEANSVKNAIDYLLVYDLAVGRDKNKLYKKLNGKTPNEILAAPRG